MSNSPDSWHRQTGLNQHFARSGSAQSGLNQNQHIAGSGSVQTGLNQNQQHFAVSGGSGSSSSRFAPVRTPRFVAASGSAPTDRSDLARSFDSNAMWTELSEQHIQRHALAVSSSKMSEQRYLGIGAEAEHHLELHPVPRGTAGEALRTKEDFQPNWVRNRRSQSPLRDRDGPASFETSSTDIGSLSCLVWNPGNLSRSGQQPYGSSPVRRETMLHGYITGAFHCMLLQEAAEIDLRHLRTYDVHPVFDNSVPDLKTLQSGSGRKVGEIMRAAAIKSPWKTKDKVALHYHIAKLSWYSSEDELILHASVPTWQVLNFHLDHSEAIKREWF